MKLRRLIDGIVNSLPHACMYRIVLTLFLIAAVGTGTGWADPLVIARAENVPDHDVGERILSGIYVRAGIRVRFVALPSVRALVESNAGRMDGELQRIYSLTSKYKNLRRILTPFFYSEIVAFTRDDFVRQGGSLLDQPVAYGVVRGMLQEKKLVENVGTLIEVVHTKQLLRMLSVARIKIGVLSHINGLAQVRMLHFDHIMVQQPPLNRQPLYHYLHKKNEALVSRIDTVIKEMLSDGSLETLQHEAITQVMARYD